MHKLELGDLILKSSDSRNRQSYYRIGPGIKLSLVYCTPKRKRTFEVGEKKVRMCLMFMMISACLSLRRKSCGQVVHEWPMQVVHGEGGQWCGATDNFLFKYGLLHVLTTRYSEGVAKVLSKTLLCLIFSSDGDYYLPHALRYHVRSACKNIAGLLLAGENPIEKTILVISGCEREFYLNELGGNLDGGGENVASSAQNGRGRREADQLQDKQTIKKRELLQIKRWPMPVRYSQTQHKHL